MITDNKNIKIPYNKILFTDKQEKEIIKMYTKEKISSVKIGKIFGCSHKVILRLLEKK